MNNLHSQIMNLPCKPPDHLGANQRIGYRLGHKDARHDAAELAGATEAMVDAMCQAVPALHPLDAQAALEAALGTMAITERAWPKEPEAGRQEDMGQGHLRVGLDSDNDVYVAVWDGENSAGVEFCNPGGGGGGRSSRTRMALIALMVAMQEDNAERPELAFPRRAA